jgi:hypothetical protein
MAAVEAGRISIQDLAQALLARDDFQLRLLVQAWQREQPELSAIAAPSSDDARLLSAAAALVELLALRAGQPPPTWTHAVGPLSEPFFALAWAERPGFTRDLCLAESPEPLKRRNIFAPPNFLMMA